MLVICAARGAGAAQADLWKVAGLRDCRQGRMAGWRCCSRWMHIST